METTEIAKHEMPSNEKLSEYLDVMGIGVNMTDKEKILFIEISKSFGLNPFKREIHVSKYSKTGTMSIIVGYETYIKRAERSGMLDGWSCVTEGSVEKKDLKAILTIHRKDRKFPFVHEVFYSEYVQTTEVTKEDGKGNLIKTGELRPTKFWQKAHTMIKKVAMAQGFRLCFSDELGGMPYTSEEMPETPEIKPEGTVTVLPPTPQPTIDNHVHASNSIKKCTTMAEVVASWKRTTLETQSHPAVEDELNAKIKQLFEASTTEKELADSFKAGKDGGLYSKTSKNIAFVSGIKDEVKLKLTSKA